MHLIYLAIGPDTVVSCLLDWTDDSTYVTANTRDQRLTQFWDSYKEWCQLNNIPDRAQRKLFTVSTLAPDAAGYVEISQKKLSATACRYMLLWLKHLALDYALSHGADGDVQPQLGFENLLVQPFNLAFNCAIRSWKMLKKLSFRKTGFCFMLVVSWTKLQV